MTIVLSLVGLIGGAILGAQSGAALGAIIGVFAGFVLSRISKLQDRIARLEKSLASEEERALRAAPEPPPIEASEPDITPAPTPVIRTSAPRAPEPAPAATSKPAGSAWEPEAGQKPDVLTRLLDFTRTWFTTGNVPVKVGVIVSFFGIAFLFKYAVDNELLRLPIELRLVGVSIFGMVLLGLGWRLRARLPVYALSLQGGGVGVLYLTIFAAMRLFELLPAGTAFVLLVLLTAGAGVLAVVQDSRALAILGTVGGFFAPILVSTGSGNHVVLFSYYLVLNAAILGIAWFRAWRELNIIGFVFTFIIGGAWGYENYRPELFASTEPFLVAHFVFYQAIAILFAVRQAPDLKGIVDGTLVFGTPVVAFALQARVVSHFEYGLAISAALAALLYAMTATALFRASARQFRLLVEAFLALGVAFATIAIPLALDARWTAAAWALEGAALVWIGVRQDRFLARLTGAALAFAAGTAFGISGWQAGADLPVLNGNYLGGMLIGLAALFSAFFLDRKSGDGVVGTETVIGRILFAWGIAWCIGSGIREFDASLTGDYQPAAYVAYFTLLAAGLFFAGERLRWVLARTSVLAWLATLALPAAIIVLDGDHPLANLGWIAWPLAGCLQYYLLWRFRGEHSQAVSVLHIVSLLAPTALITWEAAWQIQQLPANSIWIWTAVSVIPGLVAMTVVALRDRLQWPIVQNPAAYVVTASGCLLVAQTAVAVALNLQSNGDPAPLAYLPLLNPLDLATAFAVIAGLRWLVVVRDMPAWLTRNQFQVVLNGIGLLALATSTAAVIRAVHHLGGVPWEFELLFESVLVQAALSIYWGMLGFGGMVWGARSRQRRIWLVGATLMGIVVVKLFLVDLGNTGTIERIVSFIGTGALLLVVGYFAPVPPREPQGADELSAEDA